MTRQSWEKQILLEAEETFAGQAAYLPCEAEGNGRNRKKEGNEAEGDKVAASYGGSCSRAAEGLSNLRGDQLPDHISGHIKWKQGQASLQAVHGQDKPPWDSHGIPTYGAININGGGRPQRRSDSRGTTMKHDGKHPLSWYPPRTQVASP